ncbi:MAG: peptide-methionine (S)-S-oxide reductase MsrA [Pseudomonadota bacterium]
MVRPDDAPIGRDTPEPISDRHHVTGNAMMPPFPEHLHRTVLALGCYWGGERAFWDLPGIYTTAAGYAGGSTANPTYDEVVDGKTGHVEAVQVIYDPAQISFQELLAVFWQAHDPTQGDRQGIETGRQYHSVIFTNNAGEQAIAESSRDSYQRDLIEAGHGAAITTEIRAMAPFYHAADHEQQYLAKNPDGPNTLEPTGVAVQETRKQAADAAE